MVTKKETQFNQEGRGNFTEKFTKYTTAAPTYRRGVSAKTRPKGCLKSQIVWNPTYTMLFPRHTCE